MSKDKCLHNWTEVLGKNGGFGGYLCSKCNAWSKHAIIDSYFAPTSKDQFAVKPRVFNPKSYRYIFTGKHHVILAQIMAKHRRLAVGDAKRSVVVLAMIDDVADMLQADNNQFNRDEFMKLINS